MTTLSEPAIHALLSSSAAAALLSGPCPGARPSSRPASTISPTVHSAPSTFSPSTRAGMRYGVARAVVPPAAAAGLLSCEKESRKDSMLVMRRSVVVEAKGSAGSR
jgi:hypothetical protein